MSNNYDLESRGSACVYEAAYGMIGEPLDFDALAEAAREAVWADAENACIYYSDALDIISRYESKFESDADEYGKEYKPSEWRDAMTAYAFGIANAAIGSAVEAVLTDIEDKADVIRAEAENHGADVSDCPVVSRDCPHGWAPHELETVDGVHYWAPAQMEGCHAVAVPTDSGLWLSYTWPAASVPE